MEFDFDNWGNTTTAGIFAGMIYGGTKEALATSETGMHTVLPFLQSGTDDHREKRRLWREAMEQRFLRLARGTLVGGVKLGLFAATFSGIQNGLATTRGRHDTVNVVTAGAVSAGLFGLASPGSVISRLQMSVIGTVLGAVVCLPLGYAETELRQRYAQGLQEKEPGNSSPPEGVERVIRRLEGMAQDEIATGVDRNVATSGSASSSAD